MKITDEQIINASKERYPEYEGLEIPRRLSFQTGAKWALSQMQPIPTSERLPTKEDADEFEGVLAYDADRKLWSDQSYKLVEWRPGDFPLWISYPEPPKESQ